MTSTPGSTPCESFREQLERLDQMAADDGATWDLSVNDRLAVRAVLRSHADLLRTLDRVWRRVEVLDIGNRERLAIRDLLVDVLDAAMAVPR